MALSGVPIRLNKYAVFIVYTYTRPLVSTPLGLGVGETLAYEEMIMTKLRAEMCLF